MRRFLGATGFLIFLFAFEAVAGSGVPGRFKVCRYAAGPHDCIEFKEGCAGGLRRTISGAAAGQCAAPTGERCGALEELARLTSSGLPADDKVPSVLSCSAYALSVPGRRSTICIDRDPEKAVRIQRLHNVLSGLCPSPKKEAR